MVVTRGERGRFTRLESPGSVVSKGGPKGTVGGPSPATKRRRLLAPRRNSATIAGTDLKPFEPPDAVPAPGAVLFYEGLARSRGRPAHSFGALSAARS